MKFVKPETKRYWLENGDWIELKVELTIGEERRFRTRGMRSMTGVVGGSGSEPSVDIDWSAMALARVEAYLVEWSEKVAITKAAIESLSVECFEEIDQLVQKHQEAMAEAKKPKATVSEESVTQPSS